MLGTTELAATTSSKSGFNPSTLILILVVVVAFYFLMIRPQQRRKQQAAQQKNNVEPGARVRTTAGMYATVVDVDGDDVILEVAPGIEVRYMKRAIMDVVTPPETTDEDETAVDETDEADEATDYYGEEPADTVADDDDTVAPVDDESEETAYEQATGTKKD
jgi:preprotein translocase subunit YajC